MENPKMASASFCEMNQLDEQKNSQKISVSSQPNSHYTANSDSFVIDMNGFSNGGNKETSANSRITRNLSRKGSQRACDKMITCNSTPSDRDSSSSRGGSPTQDKSTMVAAGSQDHMSIPQVHHQITITTNGATSGTGAPSIFRRNSFRRSPTSWCLDPKKVLLFFATVSCIGSMVLIYFTLTIAKHSPEETGI